MTEAATSPTRIDDGRAIERILNDLFVLTDAKDWVAVRALFVDEIDVDFSSLGGAADRMPADALVGGWESGLHAQKESHHMTSNHRVRVDGDRAEATAQGYAYNRLTGAAAEDVEDGFWEVWGTYTIPFVRSSDGWRMSGMTFEAKHTSGNPEVPAHALD